MENNEVGHLCVSVFIHRCKCYVYPTFSPLYVQLPNFISQSWSSKGNQVMSIWHVDLKIPATKMNLEWWIFFFNLEEYKCRRPHLWPQHWWGKFHQKSQMLSCTSGCPGPRWGRVAPGYQQCCHTLTHSTGGCHQPIPKSKNCQWYNASSGCRVANLGQ